MNQTLIIPLFLALFGLFACSESQNKTTDQTPDSTSEAVSTPEWQELGEGLYINRKGELGYATAPDLIGVNLDTMKSERAMCPNQYLTHFGYDDSISLSSVIDQATFKALGAGFYRDKNQVYHYFATCDGGAFNQTVIDPETIEMLGDCYARDKNGIYCTGNGFIDEPDLETFKTIEGEGCVAKDKNGYFFFGERMTEEELNDPGIDKVLAKLDAV